MLQNFVRRAKQPALLFIVLYTRSSRTTESSFAGFKIYERGRLLFKFLQFNRENSVLLLRILIPINQNEGEIRDGQNCC